MPVRVVVFAKVPVAGRAKTRLIPAVGREGSARLASELLCHTVCEALSSQLGTVELCVTPVIDHPAWPKFITSEAILWTQQVAGDLGTRMCATIQRVVKERSDVLLMGTDCPQLNANLLQRLAAKLDNFDAVMVPVNDGGYALIGISKRVSLKTINTLFEDIPWSTPQVAEMTRQRIHDAGLQLWESETLNDIDEPEDLRYLPAAFIPSQIDL